MISHSAWYRPALTNHVCHNFLAWGWQGGGAAEEWDRSTGVGERWEDHWTDEPGFQDEDPSPPNLGDQDQSELGGSIQP